MKLGKTKKQPKNTDSSCLYCQTRTPITCNECSESFCNNTSEGISHIIYHMVKTKHKILSICEEELKCVKCNENNLFRLGMEEDIPNEVIEGLVNAVKLLNIDGNTASLENIATLEKTDCQKDILQYDDIQSNMTENNTNILQLTNLNEIRSKIYCGRCSDLPRIVKNKTVSFYPSFESDLPLKSLKDTIPIPKIRLYFDPKSYLDTFIPMIDAERDKEKEVKENMKQENVNLTIKGEYCYFNINRGNSDFKINVGDEVKFIQKTTKFKGYVCEEQFSDQVKVRITTINPVIQKGGYMIQFIWNGNTYRRMKEAILELYSKRKENMIFQYIMRGNKNIKENIEPIDEVLIPDGFCNLNESQKTAVKAALSRTLTLIQGPPGTGKTIVSTVIVYNLVKQFKKRVLVVAPSNTAADQLAIKLNSTGIRVLRIMSKRREDISNDVDFLCLHNILKQFADEKKQLAEKRLLELSEVVCCTCTTAGKSLLRGLEFPFVLIDEAVQSTEPLSLIPCVYNPKKLILVGDHKQLGPTILNKDITYHGYKQSLFERLLKIGVPSYMLSVQYRMHPDLCSFPSEYFYNGLLQSGTSADKVLDLPNNFFYVCDGKEETSQNKTSFINKSEAAIVENIIRFLFKNGVLEQQIGVITPYEGQRSHILGQIFGNEPGNIEIKNVDGFQGREKDFIIVSLVRSNISQGIGFVGDKRRMNVTLTRAKHGLIIVGNPFTLYKNKVWADLLNWYDSKGMVYEGPLNGLRQVSLKSLNLKEE